MNQTNRTIGFLATALLLTAWSGQASADSRTISAIIAWQGQGQIYEVSADRLRFLGALEGIMYVETAEGDMNEAFVRCPIVQEIDSTEKSTSASGNCMIVAGPEDSAYAEITCDGKAGVCRGKFTLTGGTGRFEGISGSGDMTVRSPVHALAEDLSQGISLHLAAGILQIPRLEVTTP